MSRVNVLNQAMDRDTLNLCTVLGDQALVCGGNPLDGIHKTRGRLSVKDPENFYCSKFLEKPTKEIK